MSGSIVLALRLVTTLALFAFLAWALIYLYREVQRQSSTLASRRVPRISITVRHGGGTSSVKQFSQPEITLGRDPGSDIPLPDDTVSTRHAQLTYHHGQWWLEDLASTNGTMLNDTPITMPTVITSGDEIRCGEAQLLVGLSENIIIEPTLRIGKKENG
ncbi:MAG: FHA domain-containing protein [Anaerolineales bacterium]|jgi:pSer/pThr/pTyr-binding forkhead associated (FHA) protein|nr:FHA domain-containing protein [Anaerolineales bacterium]WKZ38687.1 MAG: FHA domain-containing protein [Anaerolineales bacterium]